ncbi:methyl-branched lipid omega-hydroxylase Cyp124 [Pseudonocardia eucalypti]|uniref:Methyl-branched lipid omega-hydroxylase Cyp124 n=1 Tax=Pseudonocardia eucalypti TaxID=648755 RepID=A0ABP9RBD0_9PSEU|nr:cytochrome P450 [Pseudonocardia eucalypti]
MTAVAAGIDLLSSKSFADGHPVDQYRWLRENAPVYRHAEPDGPGFWAVTGYDQVRQVSKQPDVFSSAEGGIMINDFPAEELAFFRTMILVMDPPKHSFYRRLVSGLFTPKRAELWRDSIGDTVRAILDEVCERGECDLVEDIAGKLPSYVIAELLGIPRADGERLYELTEVMHSAPDTVSDEQRFAAMREITGYAVEVRSDKLANPADDLASRLVTAEVDGRTLDEHEFTSFFLLLVNAGGDTTRNLIGGATLSLLARPAELARLHADLPGMLPAAVEELLRFQSPVIYMRRTALADVELAGQRISAGDKVAVYYGAANRDPSAFEAPEELRLDRTPNEHVAFGAGGPHFCLGSHFGRIEAGEMMGQLLTRFPDLELTGAPTWLASNFISGPTHVPVRFTPTAPLGA